MTIRTIYSTKSSETDYGNAGFVSKLELDSHADTTVAGKNCVAISFTDRACKVQPYSDSYEPIDNVPIATVATGYTAKNGLNYIIILPEALYMPDLDHSLVNPNQLRHFGTTVHDNPFHTMEPMRITSPDNEFTACLESAGVDIFLKTWAPSDKDLQSYPHIILASDEPWNPSQVKLPGISNMEMQAIEMRNVAANRICETSTENPDIDCATGHTDPWDVIYNVDDFQRRIISSAKVSSTDLERRVAMIRFKDALPPIIPGPIEEREIEAPYTFLSSDRHSSTTPEALSERWNLSYAQAALTLRATTRNMLRSALMPLARRYRADRMFQRPRLQGIWATDTMDLRCTSVHGERYCQVFANTDFFAAAYPIVRKADCHEGLDAFFNDFGEMETIITDGSSEQTGSGTEFRRKLRSHRIDLKISEKDRPNQNPAEGTIREVRKRWYRMVFKSNCPKRLWTYGVPWTCSIMRLTASYAGRLQGRTPIEVVTGETPDISEYLDFGWYDWVWFKPDAGVGAPEIGRFLGIARNTGSLMSYHVLPSSGIPAARTTVQRVTEPEKGTDAVRERMDAFTRKVADRYKEGRLYARGDKPDLDQWTDLVENDPAFAEEFGKTFSNPDVPEADTVFDPDCFDGYIGMEIAMDTGPDDEPQKARVVKRLKGPDGQPIGVANANPILDTRLYEVEYIDGHRAALSANIIAENLFAQVDQEGHRQLNFSEIIGHRNDGTQIQEGSEHIISRNGVKRRMETTKGWEINIAWRDGSTTWNALKDVKDSYPVQMAEYAVENNLTDKPAFKWWIKHILRKRDRIISRTKSSYWVRTHKYGFEVPKNWDDCVRIDKENENTLWQDAVRKEMGTVRPAFEEHEGDLSELVGYQKIGVQFVFDIKLGEGFRRKARLVALGNRTKTPSSLTYSSVVARDSVRIALTAAALNGLDILVCDIEGAYLTAKCREKVYIVAGPEFGSEQDKIMVVKMALYGLKSSGAAFRSKLAGVLHDMGYRPTYADPDVWLKAATKPGGFEYYEMVLCYVDDLMVLSHQPQKTIDGIQAVFKLKGDAAAPPDMYLGVELKMKKNAGPCHRQNTSTLLLRTLRRNWASHYRIQGDSAQHQ
jgi:hypothetical protein